VIAFPFGMGLQPRVHAWLILALVRLWPKTDRETIQKWLAGLEDAAQREQVMARIQKYLH
jgi:hypothetical protein